MFKKGVYIGGMHGLQRKTLIRFLRKIAAQPNGMMRADLYPLHTTQTAELWNTIRDTPYPKGLRGLISEEKCQRDFDGRRYPRKWFLTDAGRQFLAAVSANPKAMPSRIGYQKKFVSDDARELARQERIEAAKYQKNLQKWQRRQRHPKHSTGAFDEPPKLDVDINSPEFKRLPSLERVRILRARKAKESESFYIEPPVEPWTAAEWAEVQRQISGKPRAPKPQIAPEPEPSLPAEPEPPKTAQDMLDKMKAKMSPEQLAEHNRRVAELLKPRT